MQKNYMKRSLMLLGVAALSASAFADTYVDITSQYIKDPTFVPGWQGVIGNAAEGVGEVWNGAFKTYQNLGEMPAGKYVLKANAFYRCGDNNYAKEHQAGNADLNTAYIFINDAKTPVKALFDGKDTAPNSMTEANEAFAAGEYLNEVEYNHEGGELIIGIANTGCYADEWCCFDNFVLTRDGEVVADKIVNGDFAEGLDSKRAWDNHNSENKEKTPDIQKDGSGGGDYRKCGGSPYNTGQQIELPAGTYRFSMLCFHRYGSTVDPDGNYYNHKWYMNISEPYGKMNRTPKDWYEANDYDEIGDEYAHAYIYMSKNEEKPRFLTWANGDYEGDLTDDIDVRTRVKDCWEICEGDLSIMPNNNPYATMVDGVVDYIPYDTKNKCTRGNDSGSEREAATAFANEGEKWRQGVEFTLTEPAKVWVGLGKDANSGDGYWHAYADIKLEKVEKGDSGVDGIEADDENAPVEYYNLQGIRVANPENGIFIKKQGKKVSKTAIR